MRNLYSASGYFLDKMELKFMWLDSQAERINEEEEKTQKGEEDAIEKRNQVLVEE